jgi:hypothetical protein
MKRKAFGKLVAVGINIAAAAVPIVGNGTTQLAQ